VPSRLLRKSTRHWEGLSGCSVPLLPRASPWVTPGVGAGLGPTRGLPRGRLGACVTSSPAGCGDYVGPPWPGKCGSGSGPVISCFLGPLECRVVLSLLPECADNPRARPRAIGESQMFLRAQNDRSTKLGLPAELTSAGPWPCPYPTRRFCTPLSLGLFLLSFCPCPSTLVTSLLTCLWLLLIVIVTVLSLMVWLCPCITPNVFPLLTATVFLFNLHPMCTLPLQVLGLSCLAKGLLPIS
jgi:hypothetical protein